MSGWSIRVKAAIDRALGGLLVVVMALLVLDVLWQVFTRFVLRDPSGFTDELARFLLIWVGLLGAAYVTGQRGHLAIDLLPRRLEGRAADCLGIGIQVAIAAFATAVLVAGGYRLMALTFLLGQSSAALGLPLGWVYAVLPVSGTLIVLYSVLFAADHLRALRERPR